MNTLPITSSQALATRFIGARAAGAAPAMRANSLVSLREFLPSGANEPSALSVSSIWSRVLVSCGTLVHSLSGGLKVAGSTKRLPLHTVHLNPPSSLQDGQSNLCSPLP